VMRQLRWSQQKQIYFGVIDRLAGRPVAQLAGRPRG
jgi:hypothetical protein